MKRFVIAMMFMATMVALPTKGHAYAMTCGAFVSNVLSDDPLLNGGAVGHSIGAVDEMANLLCFVGNSRCGCMSTFLVNESSRNQFIEILIDEIDACGESGSAAGAAQNAAFRICG